MRDLACPICRREIPAGGACPEHGAPPLGPRQTTLAEGAGVGEYILEAKIGEGGMGEVWRAHHPIIGKRAAIKVLCPDLIASRNSVARFIQEARAVNAIQHKNIVDIFGFG